MNTTQHTPDLAMLKAKARNMSDEALNYSRNDAMAASRAIETLERAGLKVLKTSGYYLDEAGVYSAELERRKQIDDGCAGEPIVVLGDGDTYDIAYNSHLYVITQDGYDELINTPGAMKLRPDHIARKIPMLDLFDAWVELQRMKA